MSVPMLQSKVAMTIHLMSMEAIIRKIGSTVKVKIVAISIDFNKFGNKTISYI